MKTMRERFRSNYKEMERSANEFLKHKCNYEMKPRYTVVEEYGLEDFENFIEQEIKKEREEIVDLIENAKKVGKSIGAESVCVDIIIREIKNRI